MTLARALRLVLAATLLAAWHGALVHPLAHFDEHGGFVHLSGAHDGHDHDDDDSAPNALCDAVAAVAVCVDGRIAITLSFSGADSVANSESIQAPRGPAPPAYRSQAPPQFS
ncbi:MAG: hypothetical protein ACT4P9_15175 [Betaproteobacteria bacterium]